MSFFDGFIQGAAESASGILDQQIQNDSMLSRQKALADYNEQLEERKQRAKQQLQSELGQKINDGADLTNRQRIADKINADNGSSMTEADAAEIAKNPAAAKAYGIIDRTRAQELDDKASAADKLGATEQAKMIRDQQNIEVNRASNERRITADEKRNELQQRELERKSKLDDARMEHWTESEKINWAKMEKAIKAAGGGGEDSAKIKTANVYLDRVNAERKTRGEDPLTFEEAFKISNYAQKDDPEAKARSKIASDLIKGNPLLANDPDQLEKKVDDISRASSVKKRQPGQSETVTLPPQALSKLKEGTMTTFGNGQVWTIKNGKPVKVN